MPWHDPEAFAALALASDDPALRFHALGALAGAGAFDRAAELLSAPLPDEAARRLIERLFADPLLAETVLSRYGGDDAFLATAAKLAAGRIDPAAVVARPDRASALLLPMCARLALGAGRPADAAALHALARAESPDAAFARTAHHLALIAQGEADRALSLALAAAEPGNLPLLLFACHEAGGESAFLRMAAAEAEGDGSFTARLVRRAARLLLPRDGAGEGPAEASLDAALLSLRLREPLARALHDAAAAQRTERRIALSDSLATLGLDAAAAACLKRLLAVEGRNAEGMLRLSEVQERAGRPDAALAILAALERERPGEREVIRRMVENLLASGRREAALTRLEELLEQEPDDATALARAHELTAELRGDAAARPLALRLAPLAPDDPAPLLTLARTAPADGAEEAWLALLRLDPENAEALGAMRRMRRSETNRAVQQLAQKALEFAAQGDLGRAERDLRELIDLHPTHLPAYAALADTLERAGRPADALAALRRGVDADAQGSSAALRRRAGLLAAALARREEAHELLVALREMDPDDLEARMALLAVKRDAACRGEPFADLDAECAALDAALAEFPDDPGLALEKGALLELFPRHMKRPEHPSGLPLLAAAASALPDRADAVTLLVRALLAAGRSDDAIRELTAAEARGLPMADATREIAVHFAESGDEPAAALWVARVAAHDPADPLCAEGWKIETAEIARAGLVKASDHLKMLRRAADTPADLARLGHAYLALPEAGRMFGDPWSTALDLFKQTLALDDRFAPACAGLRDLALKAGPQMPELLPEAERNLRRALERIPESGLLPPAPALSLAARDLRRPRAHLLACLAELLDAGFGKERKKEAAALYEKSLACDWFEPRVHHLAAGCLRILKDTRRAAFHYGAVIDLTRSRVMRDEAVRALNYLRRAETM